MLTTFRSANIIGAANVHTQFTWPEKHTVFVLCEEPRDLMVGLVGYSWCDEHEVLAYEYAIAHL